jgi:hypothetical protein
VIAFRQIQPHFGLPQIGGLDERVIVALGPFTALRRAVQTINLIG